MSSGSRAAPGPLALALAAAAGLLAGAPPGAASGPEPPTVRITGSALEPETLRIDAGERVAWSNRDAHLVVLSFSPGLSDALLCPGAEHGPGVHPTFHPEAGGQHLESAPIRSERFSLPCPLPPGSHDYVVHLVERDPPEAVAVPPPVETLEARLRGRLVVSPPQDEDEGDRP